MFTDDDLRELSAPRRADLYQPSTYDTALLRDDDAGSALEASRYALDPTREADVRRAFEEARCDVLWRSRSFVLECDACDQLRDFVVERDGAILCSICAGRRRNREAREGPEGRARRRFLLRRQYRRRQRRQWARTWGWR